MNRVIYTCDRCKQEISDNSDHYRVEMTGLSVDVDKDLCRKCSLALSKFLSNAGC